MSISVKYGNYSFEPLPIISSSSATESNADGTKKFNIIALGLNGYLLPSGEKTLTNINTKQDALLTAFSTNQLLFEIKEDSTVILSCYPYVDSVDFAEGTWADRSIYTISLRYYENFSEVLINSKTESWSYSEDQETENITIEHSINAEGRNTATSGASNAFVNAKDWVLSHVGSGQAPSGAPYFLPASGAFYNSGRTENIDIGAGTYAINESWVTSSGDYKHEYTSSAQKDDSDNITVDIQGTVTGMGVRLVRFDNAKQGWTEVSGSIYGIASGAYTSFGGKFFLETELYSSSYGENSLAGTITYGRTYRDKEYPSSGIKTFEVSIQDTLPTEVWATVPIPFRSDGPIKQNMYTSSEGQRTVAGSVKAFRGATSGSYSGVEYSWEYARGFINANVPSGEDITNVAIMSKSVTRDDVNSLVNFSVTWSYNQPSQSGIYV
jgi:hypothetical protein